MHWWGFSSRPGPPIRRGAKILGRGVGHNAVNLQDNFKARRHFDFSVQSEGYCEIAASRDGLRFLKNLTGYYLRMVGGSIGFIVQLSQRRDERLMGVD